MLNQVMLIGRIVKDPVVSTTKDGRAFTHISLAVRRSFKNLEGNYDTDFITCTAWRKTAEMSGDYCTKGSLVCIMGRVQTRSQEIEENKRMSYSEIIADNIIFLQLKRANRQPLEVVPIPGEEQMPPPRSQQIANGTQTVNSTTQSNENNPEATVPNGTSQQEITQISSVTNSNGTIPVQPNLDTARENRDNNQQAPA